MLKCNYCIYDIDAVVCVISLIKGITTKVAIGIIDAISEKSSIDIMDINTADELLNILVGGTI